MKKDLQCFFRKETVENCSTWRAGKGCLRERKNKTKHSSKLVTLHDSEADKARPRNVSNF